MRERGALGSGGFGLKQTLFETASFKEVILKMICQRSGRIDDSLRKDALGATVFFKGLR